MTDELAFAAVPAAVDAFKALFSALKQAATDGLKVKNEIEARQKFTAFVKENHEHFQGSLSSELSSDRLLDAWRRRKAQALWAPYLTFTRILALKTRAHASDYEIKDLAVKLETELHEYDAIRATRSPDSIVKTLSAAEQAIYEAATNDKLSLDAVVEFLSGLASDVNSLKTDYNQVEKSAASVATTTGAALK
ncbi:MAG: hypothetical protein WA005_08685 [Candidatus Binataceae bacterium]